MNKKSNIEQKMSISQLRSQTPKNKDTLWWILAFGSIKIESNQKMCLFATTNTLKLRCFWLINIDWRIWIFIDLWQLCSLAHVMYLEYRQFSINTHIHTHAQYNHAQTKWRKCKDKCYKCDLDNCWLDNCQLLKSFPL